MTQRTISGMVGKGSVSHNSRKFHAANTDPERSNLNIEYCNEDIKVVYHEMFDDSLQRYNDKQTRKDRRIDDYYEKIRSGKQEKPFHELIMQVGNLGDTNAKSIDGQLAATILDKYYKEFQKRNPNLRVFSAHLHMDEATPHLHIDFVPFVTESGRGLDTRVSLKSALATQGFNGGSRSDTEWNQWSHSEKEELAAVMQRYDIEWKHKGIHEKHLSVYDYEKKMRSEEVAQLESKIEELKDSTNEKSELANEIQSRLEKLEDQENLIGLNVDKYDTDPKWQLPEPGMSMTANSYKTKIVEPFIKKSKDVVRSIVAQYLQLKSTVDNLKNQLYKALNDNDRLMDRIDTIGKENKQLCETVKDYRRVRKVLGDDQTDNILSHAKAEEQIKKRPARNINYER